MGVWAGGELERHSGALAGSIHRHPCPCRGLEVPLRPIAILQVVDAAQHAILDQGLAGDDLDLAPQGLLAEPEVLAGKGDRLHPDVGPQRHHHHHSPSRRGRGAGGAVTATRRPGPDLRLGGKAASLEVAQCPPRLALVVGSPRLEADEVERILGVVERGVAAQLDGHHHRPPGRTVGALGHDGCGGRLRRRLHRLRRRRLRGGLTRQQQQRRCRCPRHAPRKAQKRCSHSTSTPYESCSWVSRTESPCATCHCTWKRWPPVDEGS